MNAKKRIAIALGIALALLVAAPVGIYFSHYIALIFKLSNRPFNDASFDRATWLNNHRNFDRDNPRGPMADDLCERHLSPGVSKVEVLDLLGEPDITDKPSHFEYHLGTWGGFAMDPQGLNIYFDEAGKLKEAKIIEH